MVPEKRLKSLPSSRRQRLRKLAGLSSRVAGGALGAAASAVSSGKLSAARDRIHNATAESMVETLGEMKGLPMKLGQMLSYVDTMLPDAHRETYRQTMSRLQARTQPMDWASIEQSFIESLPAHPDEIFSELDPEPIAAASIGQVYQGRLLDGTRVAVKIQYPGIAEALRSDLANAGSIMKPLFRMIPRVSMEAVTADLKARLLQECDYISEAKNQELFRKMWADDPDIVVPRVYTELSGPQVLVSEFIEGHSWQEMLDRTTPQERSRLGAIITRFTYGSLYSHGIFNTDPHPGNYIFMPDGRIAFLDFGSVQRYDEPTREGFLTLAQACQQKLEGPRLRALIDEVFTIPDHIEPDEELWQLFERFVHLCAEPFSAPQPYRYKHDLVQRIDALTQDLRTMLMKRTLKQGMWTPERQGIVFMYRINFGLNNLLADLGAEDDFRYLIAADPLERPSARTPNSAGAQA